MAMPLIFGRPFHATAKVKIDVVKRVVSVKAYGVRIKINMSEWKEKQKEQGDAFLGDMMIVWSDESLESFFRKEGTSKKKESLPILKKPPPLKKKKVPPIEKKKPPPVVKKKQLEPEPEKKGRHPWITKFWKEKEVPEKIYSDYQCYVAERVRNG